MTSRAIDMLITSYFSQMKYKDKTEVIVRKSTNLKQFVGMGECQVAYLHSKVPCFFCCFFFCKNRTGFLFIRAIAAGPVSPVSTGPLFPSLVACLALSISAVAWRTPTQRPEAHR